MHRLNEYLTVAQAAVFLGVSKDTLRRWDKAGKLKAHRHPVTDYRLYLSKELRDFLRGLAGSTITASSSTRSMRTKSRKKSRS